VIDGVSVSTAVVSGGSQYYYKISVTFVGDSTQGKQNLLEVEDFVCGDGCTPKRSGLYLVSPATHPHPPPQTDLIVPASVLVSRAANCNC
jgi:hypothetical protein